MKYKVRQSFLSGTISIPPSKSQTIRAILFGALAEGVTVIRNYLKSPDTQAMISACNSWGIQIEKNNNSLKIIGKSIYHLSSAKIINAGNSGLALRLCSTIAAFSSSPTIITGDRSIRYNRPMSPIISGLTQLGVKVTCLSNPDYAPIFIKGPLFPGTITINGMDSQPVSSFIIASCFARDTIKIRVINPGEKPWIALTLCWLDFLKLSYSKNPTFTEFVIPGNQRYPGFYYHVPGDLSSLAFPLAAALITKSQLIISNVNLSDQQGDKEIINVFKTMGADIQYNEDEQELIIAPCKSLKGISIDINDFIDTITIIAIVACFAETSTHIKNAAVARKKECDRISCLTQELKKMKADIKELPDGLIINPSKLKGTEVSSHNDHRLGMALTIAGMGCNGTTEINEIDCVKKSFPGFLRSFVNIGANIEKVF